MSILSLLPRRIVEGAVKRANQENILIYQGSCHCGKIAFEVEGELKEVVACNCSLCSRRGSLLWAVDADKLRLLDPQADMGAYAFNKHEIRHRFCRDCGIHTHGEAAGWMAVNIRCLADVDLATVALLEFDGRSG